MLHDFYQEQERKRHKVNPLIKILLVLSVLFLVFKIAQVVKVWWPYFMYR